MNSIGTLHQAYPLDRYASGPTPSGVPVLRQNWEHFLFMSWPVDPRILRPFIPRKLELDLFHRKAWVSLTPFQVTGLHVLSLPEIPGLTDFAELNVRTYVRYKGEPGIWFFSLDAAKLLPVLGARMFFDLPYHDAAIDFEAKDDCFRFSSVRTTDETAAFSAEWSPGRLMRDPVDDPQAYFLAERYCNFAGNDENLTVTRIYHDSWLLREAVVTYWQAPIFAQLGMEPPMQPPVAYASQQFGVEFWAPDRAD